MADEDELAYLQPGFDLNTLTMPKLRNILVYHNVAFPASAKKAQLVELIEANILPKAKKLLKERDRVRRTSKGITDMSQESATTNEDVEEDDRELMPPPKTPRSRKSKSNLGDTTTATPATRRSKTPSTRKSKSRASDVDTETDPEPSRRSPKKNARRSTTVEAQETPAVRIQEPARVKREAGESPFSDDNPFQSGSSPPSGTGARRVASTSRSRVSGGRPSSTSTRQRETASPVVKREDEDSSTATYRIPVSQIVPTTEEFTPEETQELVRAGGQPQSSALVRRRKKPASHTAKSIPALLVTSILVLLGGWYRQEKVDVGYCGVGAPSWSLSSNPNIPIWIHENLQPTCEPCPPHAQCYSNMEVRCDHDYILQHHPLSLNGLVPIPPTCEPDSEKQRRVKYVADKATDLLRDRRAAVECGGSLDSGEGTIIKADETKLEISEEALKKQVSSKRRKSIGQEEFDDMWAAALDEVKAREEVEVTKDS
jgi:hypothetical protein